MYCDKVGRRCKTTATSQNIMAKNNKKKYKKSKRTKTGNKNRKVGNRCSRNRKISKMVLSKHTDFLSVLAQKGSSPVKRKMLLEIADKNDINAILQCIYNVLAGNIRLPMSIFSKLKKHKKVLRKIANRGTSNKKRVAVLKQKGGFLPFLLSAALPLLLRFIGK